MAKEKVKISDLVLIEELFKKQKWEIEEDSNKKFSLFNKFVDRYERIDKDSRDLFLELSGRFLRIQDAEVYNLFKVIFNGIYKDFLNGFNKIYILPLVNPYIKVKDGEEKVVRPKMKSGEKLKFIIELNEYRELNFHKKIILPDNYLQLIKSFDSENDLLILIDDFIGSGRTANDILEILFSEEKNAFNSDNTILLALVAQEYGVNQIYDEKNVVTFFHYLKRKAISDFYSGNEKKTNLENYLSMEKALRCPTKWQLGYERSEALVSIMNKSPNNTLPVFWYETTKMIAPFQRYRNYK